MTYEQFARQVEQAGFLPRKCRDERHWQILGGRHLVNFWPYAKGGSRYYVDKAERSKCGTLDDAIAKAGPSTIQKALETPPWEAPGEKRVGLIRRLWRLIW